MTDCSDYSLRAMVADDRDMVRAWRNQEHVCRYMFNPGQVSADEHTRWFEATLEDSKVDYRIVMYRDRPVGLANAVRIDTGNRSCYWGFYIADTEAPKGSGTCLAVHMIGHIFGTHGLDTIHAEVFDYNTASLRLHEKMGFVRTPSRDRSRQRDGEQLDILACALQRQDWEHSEYGRTDP